MTTEISKADNLISIKINGRLDTMTAPGFDNEIKSVVSEGESRDILIDCSGMEYISSAGLRSLIAMLKTTKAQGRDLTLSSLPDSIKSIFDMTGFTSIFKIL